MKVITLAVVTNVTIRHDQSTAGQRLNTAIRRTEQQLFNEARDARFGSRQQQQLQEADAQDGHTPESAMLGNATFATATTPKQAQVQKSMATKPSAFHASPATLKVLNP